MPGEITEGDEEQGQLLTSEQYEVTRKKGMAGVNHPVIEQGTAMLGVELGDLVTGVIMGMRQVADKIRL